MSTISEKKEDELFAIEWHEMHSLGFEADTACIIVTETAISMAIEMKPLTAHSFFVSSQFFFFSIVFSVLKFDLSFRIFFFKIGFVAVEMNNNPSILLVTKYEPEILFFLAHKKERARKSIDR